MRKIKFIEKLVREGKIKLVIASDDVSSSYFEKSQNSLKAAKILYAQSLFEESVSMSYYSMFHISLSLFYKVGIKCENHGAVIILLKELFGVDNSRISFAKEERIDKQYYIDFEITKDDSWFLIESAEVFISEVYYFCEKLSLNDVKKYNEMFRVVYFDVNE